MVMWKQLLLKWKSLEIKKRVNLNLFQFIISLSNFDMLKRVQHDNKTSFNQFYKLFSYINYLKPQYVLKHLLLILYLGLQELILYRFLL